MLVCLSTQNIIIFNFKYICGFNNKFYFYCLHLNIKTIINNKPWVYITFYINFGRICWRTLQPLHICVIFSGRPGLYWNMYNVPISNFYSQICVKLDKESPAGHCARSSASSKSILYYIKCTRSAYKLPKRYTSVRDEIFVQ